ENGDRDHEKLEEHERIRSLHFETPLLCGVPCTATLPLRHLDAVAKTRACRARDGVTRAGRAALGWKEIRAGEQRSTAVCSARSVRGRRLAQPGLPRRSRRH